MSLYNAVGRKMDKGNSRGDHKEIEKKKKMGDKSDSQALPLFDTQVTAEYG